MGTLPLVLGKRKDRLTKAQYDVIEALETAGDVGLTKDKLEVNSKHTDARKVLRRLADSDPDWAKVIQFPGKNGRGKGYRLLP